MERMLKARAGAARMALMNTQDPTARDIISNAQANAIVELAKKDQGLATLSAEARATLLCLVQDAPWAQGDLVKVLQALSEEPMVKGKTKRLPLQVRAFAIDMCSNQQQVRQSATTINIQQPSAVAAATAASSQQPSKGSN